MSTAPDDYAFPSIDHLGGQFLGLTAREHAAIALRVPDSGNEWLDAMIRTAQRDELMKEAMAAIVGGITSSRCTVEDKHLAGLSVMAGKIADAMLSGAATQIAEGE